MDELKPCPFCGKDEYVWPEHYEDGTRLYCQWCGMGLRKDPTHEEAETRWNHRPTESAAVAAERQRVLGLYAKAINECTPINIWAGGEKFIFETLGKFRAAIESGESAGGEKEAKP